MIVIIKEWVKYVIYSFFNTRILIKLYLQKIRMISNKQQYEIFKLEKQDSYQNSIRFSFDM